MIWKLWVRILIVLQFTYYWALGPQVCYDLPKNWEQKWCWDGCLGLRPKAQCVSVFGHRYRTCNFNQQHLSPVSQFCIVGFLVDIYKLWELNSEFSGLESQKCNISSLTKHAFVIEFHCLHSRTNGKSVRWVSLSYNIENRYQTVYVFGSNCRVRSSHIEYRVEFDKWIFSTPFLNARLSIILMGSHKDNSPVVCSRSPVLESG